MAEQAEVDATGMWSGSELGYSWHCGCGWVSQRHASVEVAIEAEVWLHMRERHSQSEASANDE